MKRNELIQKLAERKKQLKISLENIAKLSGLGLRTVNRTFAGEDVKLSTIEKLTNLFGVDFSGNEVVPVDELKRLRAHQKALFMASLVQGTSSLERQGLNQPALEGIIEEMEEAFLHGSYRDRLWSA